MNTNYNLYLSTCRRFLGGYGAVSFYTGISERTLRAYGSGSRRITESNGAVLYCLYVKLGEVHEDIIKFMEGNICNDDTSQHNKKISLHKEITTD